MIRAILRKDWLLLWPMVALVTAIQVAIEWAVIRSGLFGDSPAALELQRPLTLSWFLGVAALVVAVVQQDPIPGADQDWLIRPVERRDLLLAKVSFVLLTVSVPMLLLNLAHALSAGFSIADSLGALLAKEGYLLAFFLLPVLALAATTRNMTELALIGVALMVAYVIGSAAGAVLLGVNRCPTCDTGMSWMEHLAQHTAAFLGAAVILSLQYFGRRTALSRGIALGGAALLVFVQIPWSIAFAVQQRVHPGAATGLTIEPAADDSSDDAAADTPVPPAPRGSRLATRALLRGDVDQAVTILSRGSAHRSAKIDVPLQVSGLGDPSLVLVDRVEIAVLERDGRVIEQHPNADESFMALRPHGGWPATPSYEVHQVIELEAELLSGPDSRPRPVRLDYTLTRMGVVEVAEMNALHGEYRSRAIGWCGARLEQGTIVVRCQQVGQAPFCYSATLYPAGGAQAAAVLKCWPDYRPYGAMLGTLTVYGADLPLNEGLTDASALADARVLLRVYREQDHFKRRVTSSGYRILDVR